ncbi:hypothetical protein, partial [Geotalea toluenoxydans]|uniref:hypothetical protein n=1 Tax=Geotalea toluenoxydans TaxID=421624 RepID=UPI001FB4F952
MKKATSKQRLAIPAETSLCQSCIRRYRRLQQDPAFAACFQGPGVALQEAPADQGLFEEDTRALLPLPRTAFDPVRYDYLKADGYGKVR